jgi:EmrB/QacA subfamily drug resistance transporter
MTRAQPQPLQAQFLATAAFPVAQSSRVLTAMSGLLLGLFLGALDQTIVATALPTIVGDIGGLRDLSWVVTAYILASTVSLPLWGKAGDVYGRKRLFEAALVIFIGGSALCGVAGDMTSLIAFRAVQGLGTGGMFVLAMAIVGDLVSPRERGRYQGYIQATFALASVAGPLVGGFLVDHVGWRSIFYVNLPLGLIALGVTASALHIPHTPRPQAIDYLGAGLLAGSISSALLALIWGGTVYSWGSPQVVALAIGSLLLTILFVVCERRVKEPVLPLALLANRTVALSSATLFVSTFAVFGAVVFLPQFLQTVRGESATDAGLLLLPMMLMTALSATLVGRLISATGRYKVFPIVGSAIAAATLVGFATIDGATSPLVIGALMAGFGFGFGMIGEVMIVAVQNVVDGRDIGTAMGAANLFRALGGAVGTAVLGSLLVAQVHAQLRQVPAGLSSLGETLQISPAIVSGLPPATREAVSEAVSSGLAVVFLVAAGAAAAGFFLSLAVPERPLRQDAPAG